MFMKKKLVSLIVTTSGSSSLSSDSKSCTVHLQGFPKNASGIGLATVIYADHIFYAN